MKHNGEGNGNPLQYSCLENPRDRGAWQAVVRGIARVGHDLVTKPIKHISFCTAKETINKMKRQAMDWKKIQANITSMWNPKKNDTNEFIYETGSQTLRPDLWLPKGRGDGGGMQWECGVSRCKLLYVEWINNKVLLYSKGNHIQYSVINHIGKEYFQRMSLYISEPLCCIAEINITL